MFLGISSFTYGWYVDDNRDVAENPVYEQFLIDKAAELGLNCLQIGDNIPLNRFANERLNNLKKKVI